MLCQTKGCPYAPIHLDAPCMIRCCHMFGWPLYLWMPPYVWTPPYVWIPTCVVGPPYVCTPPICYGAPIWTPLCMVRYPHVWTLPVCLDVLHIFDCPLYVWMPPSVWGIQRYEEHANIWGCPIK